MKRTLILILFFSLLFSVTFPLASLAVVGDAPEPATILKPNLLPGPPQSVPSGGSAPPTQDGTSQTASQTAPNRTEGFQAYIQGFAGRLLPGFLGFVAITSVFAIILAGIFFLTAYGNDERIATAKKMLSWSIAGLVISMLAYAIVNIILRVPLPGTGGGSGQQTEAPR